MVKKLLLGWIIILTIAVAVLSVAFLEVKDDVGRNGAGVSVIENGLSSIEQYLEPSYHRYLQGEITALWEEIRRLKP